MSDTGSIPYGPNPWHQTSWDARAAGNFIFGGCGSGLIVFVALAGVGDGANLALLVVGAALVALGLFCVSLELGRPFRAPNVFRNPRTSWMSREAIVAALMLACVGAALVIDRAFAWPAAILALLFLYCQANIIRAARGIPAWREPLIVLLLIATGLTEGAGLFVAVSPWMATSPGGWLLALFAALVAIRLLVWVAYRQRVAGRLAAPAAAALERAGTWIKYGGTIAPLVLTAAAVALAISPFATAIAGALAALAGSYLKYTLITRAAYNQGFALVHLPVRGANR